VTRRRGLASHASASRLSKARRYAVYNSWTGRRRSCRGHPGADGGLRGGRGLVRYIGLDFLADPAVTGEQDRNQSRTETTEPEATGDPQAAEGSRK
jgi:hypothetical protein